MHYGAALTLSLTLCCRRRSPPREERRAFGGFSLDARQAASVSRAVSSGLRASEPRKFAVRFLGDDRSSGVLVARCTTAEDEQQQLYYFTETAHVSIPQ